MPLIDMIPQIATETILIKSFDRLAYIAELTNELVDNFQRHPDRSQYPADSIGRIDGVKTKYRVGNQHKKRGIPVLAAMVLERIGDSPLPNFSLSRKMYPSTPLL